MFFLTFSRPTVPMLLNEAYVNLKNQVIKAERRILKELGFCVHVKHPHKVCSFSIGVLPVFEYQFFALFSLCSISSPLPRFSASRRTPNLFNLPGKFSDHHSPPIPNISEATFDCCIWENNYSCVCFQKVRAFAQKGVIETSWCSLFDWKRGAFHSLLLMGSQFQRAGLFFHFGTVDKYQTWQVSFSLSLTLSPLTIPSRLVVLVNEATRGSLFLRKPL